MIKSEHNESRLPPDSHECQSHDYEVRRLEEEIFRHLDLLDSYQVQQISVAGGEVIKTIFIGHLQKERVFYLGHGFGGTSYMYFPLFRRLLAKGNIVLWEIRGMGLNSKKLSYPELTKIDSMGIQQFFEEGLARVIEHYKHRKICFIGHSFGAYITMKFAIKYSKCINIERCILLSPIGVTPLRNDYKSSYKSYKDICYYALSWLVWKYGLTYKTALRPLHGPLKRRLLKNFLSRFDLEAGQLNLAIKIFDVLTSLEGGSQQYFYKTFLPRVLPLQNKSIQQLTEANPIQFETVLVYGGDSDWVDKQGSQFLASKYSKVTEKKLEGCGHMLPLHIAAMKDLLDQQFQTLA